MKPEQNIPQVTFNQIVKHPVTYALIIVVSVLWFFVYKFGDSADQVNKNCEAEKQQLRAELSQSRRENYDLIQAILVKNGVIYDLKKSTDSLVRERVGNEAKKIVK